jgi:hypothetical protein
MRNTIETILKIVFLCLATTAVVRCKNAIQVDTLKVLLGDRLSFDCPQPNPTWFFRSRETDREDIIVTRYGVINVDYKNRISCSGSGLVSHKTITLNKADFDNDGIYTCLYTISTNNNDYDSTVSNQDQQQQVLMIQQRHAFNVSVYSESDKSSIFLLIYHFKSF